MIFKKYSTETWFDGADGGCWYLTAHRLRSNHSTYRYAPLIKTSLERMAGLFYPLRIEVDPSGPSYDNGFTVVHEERPLPVILQEVVQRLHSMNDATIYLAECVLATRAYVQHADDPTIIKREWLNLGDRLTFYANEKQHTPWATLELNHTLFAPVNHTHYFDNRELYRLNQPLLEQALKNWEAALGEITEFEDPKKVYRYGFLPDDSPDEWTIEE